MEKYLDKIFHFFACLFLMSFLRYLCGFSLVPAIVLVALIGVGKELFDKYVKKSEFDWYDLLADAVGILIGALI